jgi:hypothetical protein
MLALSGVSALLSGGLAVLDGPGSPAIGAVAAAMPGDQLSHPVRRTKADREPVKGAFVVAALSSEAMSGSALRPLGLDETDTGPTVGRLIIDGALRQEIDDGLGAEIMDDTEGLDDAIAALIAPAETAPNAAPQVTARPDIDIPVPPQKPAHAPLVNVPLPPPSPNAQRASLFASAPAPKPASSSVAEAPRQLGAPPSRLGFFSSLGVAQQAETKLAALTPAPAAPSRTPSITVPTPFGVPYVLQTEKVDDSCLKPQLVGLLRAIEQHYGQKVVMTSGERAKGREGSLHKTCQAADIIVPGVEAEALARYARTISGMGGVGTYCHPNMIHVDVGTPRDWHYGCGKSYFAMRDGSAGWGATPERTSLAGRTRMTVTE